MEAPTLNYPSDIVPFTPTAAVDSQQVVQLPNGKAGVAVSAIAAAALGSVQTKGRHTVDKTTTMVMLRGTPVYWDASANKAHLLQVNDADFYLGTVAKDAASADTTVEVDLNVEPQYTIHLGDGFWSVPVLTAGLATEIIGHQRGVSLVLDATAEAQKMDALSNRGIAVGTPAIVDALICVNENCDDAAGDFNVGLADESHASSADTITASLFAHIDGASLNILIESDDDTNEVAATDSTKDAVVGTPFLVQFDLRDWADIQVYINGVNVLPNSTFRLDAATGPMKLLAHVEKTANDSPGNFSIPVLGVRTFDAAA
jgi:predicted RecA/RadA family phage recombinase